MINDIIEKIKALESKRIASRIKHLRGRHDQRDHNRWPAGYQAQGYISVGGGRRAGLLSSRATGGLAGLTQTNIMMNQTKRIPPKVKTGTPSDFAPMPIDASEFQPGGKIYEQLMNDETLKNEIIKAIILPNSAFSEKIIPVNLASQASYLHSRLTNSPFGLDTLSYLNYKMGYDGMKLYHNISPDGKKKIEITTKKINDLVEMRNGFNKKIYDISERFSDRNAVYHTSEGYLMSLPQPQKTEDKEMLGEATEAMFKVFKSPRVESLYATQIGNLLQSIKIRNNIMSEIDLFNEAKKRKLNIYKHLATKPDLQFYQPYLDEENNTISGFKTKFMNTYDSDSEIQSKYSKKEWENLFDFYIEYANEAMSVQNSSYEGNDKYDRADTFAYKRDVLDLINYNIQELAESIAHYYIADDFSQKVFDIALDNAFGKYFFRNELGAIDDIIANKGYDELENQKQEFEKKLDEIMRIANERYEKILQSYTYDVFLHNAISDFRDSQNEYYKRIKEKLATINIPSFAESEDAKLRNPTPDETLRYFFQNLQSSAFSQYRKEHVDHVQRALALIYDAQSFNGKPEIVEWSEIINPDDTTMTDALGNPLVMWRSIKGVNMFDTTATDKGLEYIEQMRTSETHYPGAGVSGFGTYMKTGNIYGENTSKSTYTDTAEYIEVTKKRANQARKSIDEFFEELKKLREGNEYIINNNIEDTINDIFYQQDEYLSALQDSEESDLSLAKYKISNDVFRPMSLNSTLASRQFRNFLFSMISDSNFSKTRATNLINKYNKMLNDASVMSLGEKAYNKEELQFHNANATRTMYGEYTVGYTVNSDARMPKTFVNNYNAGNLSHLPIMSLDEQIDSEFARRYPMLVDDKNKINLGIKMAMLGYDAYYAHLNDFSTNIIVLNRAILNMPSTTLGPQTKESDIKNLIATGQPPASAQR